MRTLTDHIVPGDSATQLTISVLDEPGQGGANHAYEVSWKRDGDTRPIADAPGVTSCYISFQNGPIKEFGVNGITQESLLAIVIDRLRSFQAGPFACDANQTAQYYCEKAMYQLQARTRDRISRGVEGQTKP